MVKNLPILKAGDNIGVIALTAAAHPERFEHGINELKRCGFGVRIAQEPCREYGRNTYLFCSDTPKNRAAALQELFADPTVKAVIATRGAYGSAEVLPHLDLKSLAKNKKPLIGFSDISAFLVALSDYGKIPTIHGPVIEFAFAKADTDPNARESVDMLIKYLTGQVTQPFGAIKLEYLFRPSNLEGAITGGNLSIIASLVGTPWQPLTKGKLLFIEEVDESPFRVHRMLTQLKLAGILQGVKGVLLGNFTECVHPKGLGPTVSDVFSDFFKDEPYPVIAGIPAGHGGRNLPIPFGVNAMIRDGILTFL